MAPAGGLFFKTWLKYGGKDSESYEMVLAESFNFLFLLVFNNSIKIKKRFNKIFSNPFQVFQISSLFSKVYNHS